MQFTKWLFPATCEIENLFFQCLDHFFVLSNLLYSFFTRTWIVLICSSSFVSIMLILQNTFTFEGYVIFWWQYTSSELNWFLFVKLGLWVKWLSCSSLCLEKEWGTETGVAPKQSWCSWSIGIAIFGYSLNFIVGCHCLISWGAYLHLAEVKSLKTGVHRV